MTRLLLNEAISNAEKVPRSAQDGAERETPLCSHVDSITPQSWKRQETPEHGKGIYQAIKLVMSYCWSLLTPQWCLEWTPRVNLPGNSKVNFGASAGSGNTGQRQTPPGG